MVLLSALALLAAPPQRTSVPVNFAPKKGAVATYSYRLKVTQGKQTFSQAGQLSSEATDVADDGTVSLVVKTIGLVSKTPQGETKQETDQATPVKVSSRGRSSTDGGNDSPAFFLVLLLALPEKDLAKGESTMEELKFNGLAPETKVELTGLDANSATFLRTYKENGSDVRIETKIARDGSGLIEGKVSYRGKQNNADVLLRKVS